MRVEKIVRAGSEDFSKNGKTTVVEIKVRYSFGVVFSDLYIGDTTLIITHHAKYTQMGLACTKPSVGDCFVIGTKYKVITNRWLGTG